MGRLACDPEGSVGIVSDVPPLTKYGNLSALDVVSAREIADRLHVKLGTVQMWRYRGIFPDPDWHLATGPIWEWQRIVAWANATGRL